jgi:acetyltransferase-like isoleucine patch superfamily enzyme
MSREQPCLWNRAGNFFSALYHYLRWSWRFGSFGFRSRIVAPDMLSNTRNIIIGSRVNIWKGARIEAVDQDNGFHPRIEIGDNTSIQMYFHCGAADSVKIGRNVLIAGRVYITDHDHVFDDPVLSARQCKRLVTKPVVVEDGAWLGEGCVILKGVTVGKRAVIGANAVVTRNVPPGAVAAGIPARIIRSVDISQ